MAKSTYFNKYVILAFLFTKFKVFAKLKKWIETLITACLYLILWFSRKFVLQEKALNNGGYKASIEVAVLLR